MEDTADWQIDQMLMPEEDRFDSPIEAKREISDYERYRGKCKEMSEALIASDPTLRLVRGHYYDSHWGLQEHWWCEKPDGTVVDPTKDQFPSKGRGLYEEFNGICECAECRVEIREENTVFAGNYPCCSNVCAMRLVGL